MYTSKQIIDELLTEFPGLRPIKSRRLNVHDDYDEEVNGGDLVDCLSHLLAKRRDLDIKRGYSSMVLKALDMDESYSILDDVVGGTWVVGGCYLLASTLKRLVPTGKIQVVMGRSNAPLVANDSREGITPIHTVFLDGDVYIDANGEQSKKDLLKYWNTEEIYKNCKLVDFDTSLAENFLSSSEAEIKLAKLILSQGFTNKPKF